MKEVLIKNLDRYGYRFKVGENIIIVDLGTWQEIIITLYNDKIIIEDRLRAWNMLGTFPMKLRTALFLNPVSILLFVLIAFLNFEDSYLYKGLLIAINVLLITFSVFYLIRLEGMKNRIAIWINHI